MASRKLVAGGARLVVWPKPCRISRGGDFKPIRDVKPWHSYRTEIELLLAELPRKRLVDAWRRTCPLAIAAAFGLPDLAGVIRDLADFAVVLRLRLDGMTADQLCRHIEQCSEEKRSLRPRVLQDELTKSAG